MSLAPHVESVVFDNALTWTAHHATRNIDYNIPQQLILYFDAMFQRNVGQIRDDISSLSNKFSTLQTDFHQLNDNFSALDTKFTSFQDQFDGFQSTVHDEISNVNTVQNHFETTLHDEISTLGTILHDEISTLGNNVKTSQHQLASELRSEMRDSFKSFQQQFQANLQIEMFTLDSKFSASLKQTQSTLRDEISSLETKLFNLDTKFSASHNQLQTTLRDEIASLNTKLQNVESKIDDKLNSLNTTFSTKIHSVEIKLHDQINSLDTKLDDKFHTLNDKIDTMENRLDNNIRTLETKLDSEINSLKTNLHDEVSKLSNQITALESKLDGKICSLDMKIDNLDTKFTDQFNSLDSKLNTLEIQIHTVDNKIDKVETTINSKIDDLDTKINSVSSKVDVLNTKVTNIDNKVDRLETKVDENFTLLSERLDSVNKTMTNFIIQQTKFNDDTDKKILHINKYIQEHTKKILTIEKAVDINAEQIQDYLKLVDVRKSEIRIEFTKSLTDLSEQLDQKIAGLSQSLRSEITDLVNKQLKDISLIGQRVTALEITEQSCTSSTDTCRPIPVNQLNPNVGLLSTGVESMPAGTPVVTNSATVSTTRVVSCDYPQASYMSNSVINPVNTPSSMGQSTNHRSFAGLIPNESNLNSNIACSPSVPHSNFNDISCQNIVSNNDEPQRTMPIFDGTGDLDIFFTKFEILVTACNWTEKETICALLNDCLRGKAESIILSFPSDSVLTYHDVKYKMYVWFASMRDKYYYQKQLSEITRKPGESMQEFHSRVAILANKAYPLSPTEREKYGVEAIIKGCNLGGVQLLAVAKDWDGRTIDETVNWIMDLENRYHSYNLDKHQQNLRSMNVRDSYDRVPDRPSRGSRDNDRDLPSNYGQKSYYMSQERDRDERTFSPSSSVNQRRNSRSHYYSRDKSPVNDFSRNRSESRDNHNPSACYICGDHNHFIKNCPNK